MNQNKREIMSLSYVELPIDILKRIADMTDIETKNNFKRTSKLFKSHFSDINCRGMETAYFIEKAIRQIISSHLNIVSNVELNTPDDMTLIITHEGFKDTLLFRLKRNGGCFKTILAIYFDKKSSRKHLDRDCSDLKIDNLKSFINDVQSFEHIVNNTSKVTVNGIIIRYWSDFVIEFYNNKKVNVLDQSYQFYKGSVIILLFTCGL